MSGRAQLMWDEAVTGYDFGPGHPMDPVRLILTRRLVSALGLDREVEVVGAKPAGESTLRLVHREDYIEAVKAASADPRAADGTYGIGTLDDPAFTGMHEVSSLIAGLSVGAAEAVWRGETQHAVNFAGGLHHAMPGGAAGFCIYNDASLAIARLLELGAERVAYVDVDVHHGDGVQAAFWEDPRVLTISLHEHPRTLFPQTGWPEETGGGAGEGSAVNVALRPGPGTPGGCGRSTRWCRS
ncbi:Acetoin utilization protein AcuC OS=Streptomyces glaucescens OX=1907 GN=SGLAU_19110 PE=3 SV=1 [Streptomyces glaucescens]